MKRGSRRSSTHRLRRFILEATHITGDIEVLAIHVVGLAFLIYHTLVFAMQSLMQK